MNKSILNVKKCAINSFYNCNFNLQRSNCWFFKVSPIDLSISQENSLPTLESTNATLTSSDILNNKLSRKDIIWNLNTYWCTPQQKYHNIKDYEYRWRSNSEWVKVCLKNAPSITAPITSDSICGIKHRVQEYIDDREVII